MEKKRNMNQFLGVDSAPNIGSEIEQLIKNNTWFKIRAQKLARTLLHESGSYPETEFLESLDTFFRAPSSIVGGIAISLVQIVPTVAVCSIVMSGLGFWSHASPPIARTLESRVLLLISICPVAASMVHVTARVVGV